MPYASVPCELKCFVSIPGQNASVRGSIMGKSLILRWEEISDSSDPRLLLISRLKVRFLPRSPNSFDLIRLHQL